MVGMIPKLLDEALAAGLTVEAHEGRLIVRGPRRAGDVAQRLLACKAEILAALAQNPFDGWVLRYDVHGRPGWELADLTAADRWWALDNFSD